MPLEERVSGLVRAENQVEVRAEITARVAAVLVKSGEAVKRGQPLLRLQHEPLQQQLRQAQASVRLARAAEAGARARIAELEAAVVRTRQLAERALVAPLEREVQEAQLEAARASHQQGTARIEEAEATADERRATLDRSIVRAPIDGRVGKRTAEVGLLVTPSTPLFVIGDLGALVVEIPITEQMLGKVEEGQSVRITSAALGTTPIEAALSRISPFLTAGSFTTTGEIDVRNDDGRLRPGMFVAVDILHGESERATLVPTSALHEDPATGARGVFVVEQGGPGATAGGKPPELLSGQFETRPVRWKPIEVIAEGRSAVGVRGIGDGDWVVTVGQHLLSRTEARPARVRRTDWQRVIALQGLQQEDLLDGYLAKQQRLARTLGARPPITDEIVGGGAPARTSPASDAARR